MPASPAPNWLSFNNFRSGDMEAGDGLSAPDFTLAQGDLCDLECDAGRLIAWIHPGNLGASDQTELQTAAVVVYAEDSAGGLAELQRLSLTELLLTGTFQQALQIEISADPAELQGWAALRFVLETDARECDEGNNVLRIEGPFCAD